MPKRRLLSTLLFLLIAYTIMTPSALADGKYPVRIAQQSLIVYPVDPNSMQVVQVSVFQNNGVEGEKELPIYLPKGYQDLEWNDGLSAETIQVTEKGIVDTTGLAAGQEKQITLSYQMPMTAPTAMWDVEQAYVVEKLNVVIPAGVLSFEAMNLKTQSELIEMNGQEFRRFNREDLHPDVPWMVSFRVLDPQLAEGEKLSSSSSAMEMSESYDETYTSDGKRIYGHAHGAGVGKAIFSVSIIIVALTVALIGLRRDWMRSLRKSRRVERPWLQAEKENVLQQYAALEKDYRAQLISKEMYETMKSKLRNQLVRLTLELRQGSMG